MQKRIMDEVLLAAKDSLANLGHLISKKNREADAKWREKQQDLEKERMAQQATIIKSDLKSDLKKILKDNLYFKDVDTLAIPDCIYQDGWWELTLEMLLKTTFDLEKPRVISSLNDSKEAYFHEMRLNAENDWLEFAKFEDKPDAEWINVNLTRQQIQQRYRILDHMLYFILVKCEAEGDYTNVKIIVRYR